jgi:hypothetical protein
VVLSVWLDQPARLYFAPCSARIATRCSTLVVLCVCLIGQRNYTLLHADVLSVCLIGQRNYTLLHADVLSVCLIGQRNYILLHADVLSVCLIGLRGYAG